MPWLDGAGIPQRTAQRMMKLAAYGIKPDEVTDLGGVGAALEWCAVVMRIAWAAERYESWRSVRDEHLTAHAIAPVTDGEMSADQFGDVVHYLRLKLMDWSKVDDPLDLAVAHIREWDAGRLGRRIAA